jgi:oxygen-independent coproporphyrinogen III oxidase
MMETADINPLLISKYNQPVPRYTSYPTVPFWNESLPIDVWKEAFEKQFHLLNSSEGISIYVHLPFCEKLCTYCGCNKKITTNHKVEDEYLDALEKEWRIYRRLMNETPVIRAIHLGGGTPTFFSPANLQRLMSILLKGCIVHPFPEFSLEGHPNNTTEAHLKVLYAAGFRRVSYGVQDNDPEVQRVINRIQPIENVKSVTDMARTIGYSSVNYDLIYGLPLQTLQSIEKTIKQVIELRPDRIAFYSYAHVPWTSKGQRLFNESHLPSAAQKIELYLKGKALLIEAGYHDIGMDHFALPHDDLYKAWKTGKLHRNFMGYTTQLTTMLVGLGVSSISDVGNAFAQNAKTLHDYYADINANKLPTRKGYILSDEDLAFKRYIIDISCKGSTDFRKEDLPLLEEFSFKQLEVFQRDNLLQFDNTQLKLTAQGRYFIRNVCSAFDLHLLRQKSDSQTAQFSNAI